MVDEEPDEMLIFEVVRKIVDQLDEVSSDYHILSSPLKKDSITSQRSRHASGPPVNSAHVFYLDECRAFIQQVPQRFDLGTTPVNLNCLAVSPSYVVLGSDCGALFLYNRKINSSVRPLRTNYKEVVSCVQLYCSCDKDYLAVGHTSGTLILLSFPSSDSTENQRKLKQSIQEDTHRGQPISCVCWSEDGSKLFSADRIGLVMMCHVDFLNNQFINVFVCSVEEPVQALASSFCYLALATSTSYRLFDIEKNCSLLLDDSLKQEGQQHRNAINGVSFMYISPQLLLIICSNNGQICAHSLEDEKEYSKQLYLLNLKFLVSNSLNSSLSLNGSPSKKGSTTPCWTEEDFSIAKTLLPSRPSENIIVYYSAEKVMFCSLLVQKDKKLSAQLEVFDFEQLLEDFEQFEIVDAACAEWKSKEEIFLLTSSQKVLRLARGPASQNLTMVSSSTERPSVGVLLNSFSVAAQRSSRTLIEKIESFQNSQVASAGMQLVDNFLIGSPPERAFKKTTEKSPIVSTSEESSSSSLQSTKEEKAERRRNLPFQLPKSFTLPEEYSAKIASNFQNIFEHLKTSNLMSDYDKPSPTTSQRDRSLNKTYSSTTAGDSGALNDFDHVDDDRPFEYNGRVESNEQEKNVNVARKTRMKRAKMVFPAAARQTEELESAVPGVSSDLSGQDVYASQATDATVTSNARFNTQSSNTDNLVVPDRNLEKILGVIGLATPSNQPTEENTNTDEVGNYLFDAQPPTSSQVESIQANKLASDIFSSHPLSVGYTLQNEQSTAQELDLDSMKLASDLFSDTVSSCSNEILADISESGDKEVQLNEEATSIRSEVSDDKSFSFCRPEQQEQDHEQKLANTCNSLSSEADFVLACSPSVSNNSLFDENQTSKNGVSSSQTSTHTSSTSSNDPRVLRQLNADYSLISRLLNHLTDIWTQLIAPYAIGQMDISQNYTVICPDDTSRRTFRRRQRPHYRLLNAVDNGVMGGSWTEVKTSAPITAIAVNDESNLVWRIGQEGIAYAPVEVDPFSPMSSNSNWVEQTGGEGAILSVALTSNNAWYLTSKGVFVQMNLPEMGILFRAECPFQLTKLAASDSAVWALRADTGNLVVRVGIKHCPMGVDWVEDSLSGARKFVSIALHGNSGFGLDSSGCLWLNNGVTEENPFGVGCWYQICSLNLQNMSLDSSVSRSSAKLYGSNLLAPISKWQLKVGKAGLFINVGRVILAARQPLTGHLLSRVVPYRLSLHDNFSIISAGAFCGDSSDCIFVSQQLNSEIFSFSIKKRNFTSLPSFSESGTVIALTACRERLYLLDSCGKIHFRENIASKRFPGNPSNSCMSQSANDWIKFCEDQIPTSVISLAAASTCLWAIDSFYRIFYVTIVAPYTWTEVDRPKDLLGEKIDQIRASPTGKYVWLFSSKSGYSWARTEVTEACPKGKSWVRACSDVHLEELVVAENAVWCLARGTRQLYRLRSLNFNNPAGHYWKPMSFSLKAISVDTMENRLWGLDMDNRIVRHEMQIYPPFFVGKKSTAEENVNNTWRENPVVDELRRDEELERISPDPLHSWCIIEQDDAIDCINAENSDNETKKLPYTTQVDTITPKST